MASESFRVARDGVVRTEATGFLTGSGSTGVNPGRTPATRSVEIVGKPETAVINVFIFIASCYKTANKHQKGSIWEASLMTKFSLPTKSSDCLLDTERILNLLTGPRLLERVEAWLPQRR